MVGISTYSQATGNRVYANLLNGLQAGGSAVLEGNQVYSNPIGIQAGLGGYYNSVQVLNNLVYANSDHGILVGRTYDASNVRLVNNTVYQRRRVR
jgi:hypothetical protein